MVRGRDWYKKLDPPVLTLDVTVCVVRQAAREAGSPRTAERQRKRMQLAFLARDGDAAGLAKALGYAPSIHNLN